MGAEAVLDGYSARREDIRGRLERLQEELQTLATHEVEFTQQSGELEARMVGLRSGKSATAERQTEIETSLSSGKDALHRADDEVDALREQLAVTSSRLRSREPSSTTTHSQPGSVWRTMLRRQAPRVRSASRIGSRMEICGSPTPGS